MKAIGIDTLADLLWSFGWESCLSNSELLHELILMDDFMKPTREVELRFIVTLWLCDLVSLCLRLPPRH